MRPRRLRRSRGRGAALILVVLVVAALLAIGAPFVLSMRHAERAGRTAAAVTRARLLARGAQARAVARLLEEHEDPERRAREGRGARDEDVDDLADIAACAAPTAATGGVHPFAPTGPARAWTTHVDVVDVRARLDPLTAPHAVAALLGVTVTTAPVSWDEEEVLPVEDGRSFPDDGDPKTFDGLVLVGGELIAYRERVELLSRRRDEPSRWELRGLLRRANFSGGPPPEKEHDRRHYHEAGALVEDGRVLKLANDPLVHPREQRGPAGPDFEAWSGVAALRRMADWSLGAVNARSALRGAGVSARELRQWGLSRELLVAAGLDPDDFELRRRPGADDPAQRRLERELEGWNVPVELLWRLLGARALEAAHRVLGATPPRERDEKVRELRSRLSGMSDNAAKWWRDWVRDEARRQLPWIARLRAEAPDLEVLGPIELERDLRPFVTTDAPPLAGRWSEWFPAWPGPLDIMTSFERVDLPGKRGVARGALARLRAAPGAPEVLRRAQGVAGDTVWVKDLPMDFPRRSKQTVTPRADACVRLPTPVCVRTAPREVLEALLVGLRSQEPGKRREHEVPDQVTPREARAITDALLAEPPSDLSDLRGLLARLEKAEVISAHDVEAVLVNAVDPADPRLVRSSAPLCFTTGEVYEVTATGAVVDDAGVEVARHVTREVVRVAPPADLVWSIDTQAEWTDRLWSGEGEDLTDPFNGGATPLLLPHARAAFVETGPVYLGPLLPRPATPSRRHAPGESLLRPLRGIEARCAKGVAAPGPHGPLSPGALRQEDWADQVDGVPLGGHVVAATELPRRRLLPGESGRAQDALGPGGLRGWFRLDAPAAAGRRFLFDGGRAEGVDRLSLFLEGGELVLAADDEALDVRESQAAGLARPRAAEVRWRPARPFEAGEWLHVAAMWRGADRGDLALVVDGQLVGRETLGGRLARPVDPYTTRLVLEDASGLPPSGLVRLGPGRRAAPSGERGLSGGELDVPRDSGGVVGELLRYERIEGDALVLASEPVAGGRLAELQAAGWKIVQAHPPLPLPIPAGCRVPLRGSGRQHWLTLEGPKRGADPPSMITLSVLLGGPHVAGAHAVPYGYRSHLAREVDDVDHETGRLVRGGATLVQPLPETTPVTLLYAKVADYGLPDAKGRRQLYPQVVDAAARELPVLWAGAWPDPPSAPEPGSAGRRGRAPLVRGGPNLEGGWPPAGVVRITTRPAPTIDAEGRTEPSPLPVSVERVRYRGIDPVRGLLLDCDRGVEGTTAAAHCLFDTVVLESIVVTDPRDYPRRPTLAAPRVFVSLAEQPGEPGEAVEWLSVQRCADPSSEGRGLLLLPARDDLRATPEEGRWSGHLPRLGEVEARAPEAAPPPLLQALTRAMALRGGDLGPDPGSLPVDDPDDADHGQPWKEVLKRWTPGGARGEKGTRALAHPALTRVVPTFVIRGADSGEAGPGDVVTVTDDTGAREEARVVHAAAATAAVGTGSVSDRGASTRGWLVAFDDFVGRTYRAEDGARLARWPVGDLRSTFDLTLGAARPSSGGNDLVRDAPGACEARLDDLVVWQDDEQPASVAAPAGGGRELPAYRPLHGAPVVDALVKVDEEVVDVRDVRWVTGPPAPLPAGGTPAAAAPKDHVEVDAGRGLLGTTPQAHALETPGWTLSWPAHARASTPPDGAGLVSLVGASGDLRRSWAYVAVDRGEAGRTAGPWAGVLAFDGLRGGASLQLPVDLLGRRCFPSAFGAAPVDPVVGDVLVDLPFRVHDRPAATTRTYQGVLWQSARELPGGYLLKVDWDEELPTPFAEVQVAVRADGAPAWDGPRATAPGQTGAIHVLDDPLAPNLLLLPCDRVEVRVTLTFKPGALAAGAWKRGAVLSALRVHYRQATRTLRAEEGE